MSKTPFPFEGDQFKSEVYQREKIEQNQKIQSLIKIESTKSDSEITDVNHRHIEASNVVEGICLLYSPADFAVHKLNYKTHSKHG